FGRYVISTGEEQFPLLSSASPGQPNAAPAVGSVVLSEVQYHPLPSGDEFVELRNITSETVALFDGLRPTNTWRLNGLGYTFPTNASLPSNGVLLLVPMEPDAFRAKYSVPAAVQIFPYA